MPSDTDWTDWEHQSKHYECIECEGRGYIVVPIIVPSCCQQWIGSQEECCNNPYPEKLFVQEECERCKGKGELRYDF